MSKLTNLKFFVALQITETVILGLGNLSPRTTDKLSLHRQEQSKWSKHRHHMSHFSKLRTLTAVMRWKGRVQIFWKARRK